jgi:uncharacterized OB-fold protein
MADFPAPERTELNAPYWDSLAQGHLTFQRCRHCRHAWLPARAECPECLRADWAWEEASGRAKLVSWVVYHVAFHEWFRPKLPYNVATVELEEGPRLLGNIVGDTTNLRIDMPLSLAIETEEGIALARFRPA